MAVEQKIKYILYISKPTHCFYETFTTRVALAQKKWQEKYGKDNESRGMKYTRKALVVKFWLT